MPLQYETIRPLLLRNMRMNVLTSNSDFGSLELGDDHLLVKLDNYLKTFNDGDADRRSEQLRSLPMPDLDRETLYETAHPDILRYGYDSMRNYKSMEEKFRKGMVDLAYIRRVADPPTRIHMACCRGAEKILINYFNNIDGEMLNYKSLLI